MHVDPLINILIYGSSEMDVTGRHSHFIGLSSNLEMHLSNAYGSCQSTPTQYHRRRRNRTTSMHTVRVRTCLFEVVKAEVVDQLGLLFEK